MGNIQMQYDLIYALMEFNIGRYRFTYSAISQLLGEREGSLPGRSSHLSQILRDK